MKRKASFAMKKKRTQLDNMASGGDSKVNVAREWVLL